MIARDSEHPGANHYYIHAVEASARPEKAIRAADRLRRLIPGAGHLVHMPAHIYIRTGRYRDATEVNVEAIKADDSYVAECHAQGVYPLAYMSHNHHFLSAAAALEGRSEQSLKAARTMARKQDHQMMQSEGMGSLQHYLIWPVYMLVRFGKWDEILQEPQPEPQLKYPTGVWHFARGMAYVRKGDLASAQREQAKLAEFAADTSLQNLKIWELNSTGQLLQISELVLKGELQHAQGQTDAAIASLQQAVQLEDSLRYDEPATWPSPVRNTLGAILLEAEQAPAAEAAYREDLRRYPENGFSLFGLAKSLAAQARDTEAKEVWGRFKKAWQRADVELPSSRF